MKYTLLFTNGDKKYRTTVDADSEYYARRKLLQKAPDSIIHKCEIEKVNDIMDFLKGFGL